MRTKSFLLFPLLALALILSACGPLASNEEDRFLSVIGTGTVYLTPDIAYLYIGVHTENADLASALDQNNGRAQALVDALVGIGLASSDIKTSNFSIWTQEDWNDVGTSYTKYVVDNTVYITVRDLGQLSSLLNIVVTAGANNINSISFDVSDKTAALAEARRLALANANTLANELADAAGLGVGEIQSITYTTSGYYPYYGMGGGAAAEAPVSSVPIQPGQMEVTVNVTVSYGIR